MNEQSNKSTSYLQYLKDGGEMGERTRSFDWSKTGLGSPETWPLSLLSSLSIILKSKFPMFLWWGPELIQFYNDAYRPSLGNDGKHPTALGQRGEECWQEIWPIIKPRIDQVISTGESTWSENELIPIYRNGKLENVYWTFCYSQTIDERGKTGGVLVTCQETTENVLTVKRLKNIHHAATESEKKFRLIIEQAPVAMAIFSGPEFIIEVFNDKVLEFWGRTAEQVQNKPLFEALPEASNQGFEQMLANVLKTGETFNANELPVTLLRNSVLETTYINFVYVPVRDNHGIITGVMVVCNEVTELVNGRMKVEEAEERTRLAIEAADLGTFDYDVVTGQLITSPRLKEMMGIEKHAEHETYIKVIHPDDQEKREKAIEKAFETGKLHYEVRVLKQDKTRWIRADGKVYFDKSGKPLRLLGSMLDITDLKVALQQKDDFISIASHELKTPLTSLKATMQLIDRLKDNAPQEKILSLISKASKGLDKVNSLVEDLLNVSKFSHGQLHLNKKALNLAEVANESCNQIRIAGDFTINITGEKNIKVYADADKLEQVLVNFLNNAIKYAPKSKEIKIHIEQVNDVAKVSVTDKGQGILPEKIPHLFDRYYRVDDRGSQYSGLGLGLYICAEIIKKHKGQIGVESQIGKGSCFWFTIPL